jgi:plastocyanin
VFSLALVAGGCSSSTNAPPGGGNHPLNVLVRTNNDSQFTPDEVFLRQGGTVRWLSDSALLHSITPIGHDAWEEVEADRRGVQMLEVYFDTPGVYEYWCKYHGDSHGMRGFIAVF